MATLNEFRQQYPMYNDMPDAALADAIYTKFYTDMPRAEFNKKIGMEVKPMPLGEAVKGTIFGDIADAVTAPGRALRGDYNAEPPENPGFISETDIGRQRMAATRMEGDAFKLGGLAVLGNTAAPAGALGSGVVRPKPVPLPKVEPPTMSPRELIDAGTAGKQAAREGGDTFSPDNVKDFVHRAKTALVDADLPPELAGQTHAILNKQLSGATRAATAGGTKTDTILAGPGFHIADDIPLPAPHTAGDIISLRGTLTNIQKTPGQDAAAAGKVKEVLNDWLETTNPKFAQQVRDFTQNYRAGHLAADIKNPLNRAELSSAAANSGMNFENKVRQMFAPIVARQDDKIARGRRPDFNPTILKLMRDLVETGGGNKLRAAGNYMGGGGGAGAALYGLIGGQIQPFLIATPVIGAIIKSFGNKKTLAKVEEIYRQVISTAPAMTKQQAAAHNAEVAKAIGVVNKSRVPADKKLAMLQALQAVQVEDKK